MSACRLSFCILVASTSVFLGGCAPSFPEPTTEPGVARQTTAWSAYGGDGGTRYADLEQINKTNVDKLEVAWVHRNGDTSEVFQMTPIIAAGQLIGCSIHNKVFALDPLTGAELWRYDPKINTDANYSNNLNCRGVAAWGELTEEVCSQRIFTATNDARLIALDSKTGELCSDFGNQGQADLSEGVGQIKWQGEYQVTSPPAVVGDVIVVGSAIRDNYRVDAPSGVVRGYDAKTGELAWAFDLAPPDFDYAKGAVSDHGYALGTPNVWSAISVDAARDMVFLPTGNPAPDYYRTGPHAELSHYGSSVVALKGSTGEVLWHFNTVLRDYWDFDVPSQPVLADIKIDDEMVPVVIQSTKMGFVFVLHRETGQPVVPITYEQVPRSGPLEDQLSPVQPFPPKAFQVSRDYVANSSVLGLCDDMDANSVIGPIYTPITEKWTIGLPSNMGATNWGGVAVDAQRGLIAVRTSQVPFRTKLIDRKEGGELYEHMRDETLTDAERQSARQMLQAKFDLPDDVELAPQYGTDYLMARHPYLDPVVGLPCAGFPLGEALVIDISAQAQRWRRPHGTIRDLAPLPLPIETGMAGVGGPMITQTGLLIVAGIEEHAIRAYDMDDGTQLWHHRLPFSGNATPMSYSVFDQGQERQFIVIAAGGDARVGSGPLGDYLVAFSLPK